MARDNGSRGFYRLVPHEAKETVSISSELTKENLMKQDESFQSPPRDSDALNATDDATATTVGEFPRTPRTFIPFATEREDLVRGIYGVLLIAYIAAVVFIILEGMVAACKAIEAPVVNFIYDFLNQKAL